MKQEGLETHWYENGQKEAESNWKDGKADGLETICYENGQKREETIYKNGKEISSKEWNEDGSSKSWNTLLIDEIGKLEPIECFVKKRNLLSLYNY